MRGSVPAEAVAAAVTQAVSEAHEVPVDAVVLLKPGSIPKTSSGKIQRHACKAGYLAGTLDVIGAWQRPVEMVTEQAESGSPATEDEIRSWLVDRISRKLRLPAAELDPREPLARYGLDSLTAVQTAGELEQWLGRPISPVLVYDHPTIESLARFLSGETVDIAQSPLASGGEKEPIAIIGIGCRFPAPTGRPLSGVCSAMASTRSAKCPRTAGTSTTSTTRIPTKPGKIEHPLGRVPRGRRSLRPRILRHLPARGRAAWTRSSGCCWRWPGRRWRTPGSARVSPASRDAGVFVGISSTITAALPGRCIARSTPMPAPATR